MVVPRRIVPSGAWLALLLAAPGLAQGSVQEGQYTDRTGDVLNVSTYNAGLDIVSVTARHDTAGATTMSVRLAGPPSASPAGTLVMIAGTATAGDCVPPQIAMGTATNATTASGQASTAPNAGTPIAVTRSFDPATNTVTLSTATAIPGGAPAGCAYAVMNSPGGDLHDLAGLISFPAPSPAPGPAPAPAEPAATPARPEGTKVFTALRRPAGLARAGSSAIYGICGVSICRVDPVTKRRALVKRGTKKSPYLAVSTSAGGGVMAFARGGEVYRARRDGRRPAKLETGVDPQVRADGAAVSWTDVVDGRTGPRCYANPFGDGLECDYIGFPTRTTVVRYAPAGAKPDGYAAADGHAWAGGLLLTVRTPTSDASYLCAGDADGGDCVTPVAQVADRDIDQGAGSPDGRLLAVVAGTLPEGQTARGPGGAIVLHDARTGRRVRQLTSGRSDSDPAFSPDGRSVAFDRDGGVWVVPISGRGARLVARGVSLTGPSWSLR